jgi:hypothetical protein
VLATLLLSLALVQTPGSLRAQTPAPLDRQVARIAAETEPARWRPTLLGLVRRTLDGTLKLHDLYPHVGQLRGKLLAVLADPAWQQGRIAPAARARHLLALWHDRRDRAVIDAFLVEAKRYASRAPGGIEGRTLGEAVERWRDHHFRREGIADPRRRTANWTRILRGADGRRALVVHSVRYAHWGYEMDLVFTRAGGRWRLHLVLRTRTDHFR